ncbi:unnamed protein product [Linum trigynum]|uniref:Uncharacterized protein n=1 Tax=Linum trigynum TaxID=586398 RepID=A0AAV2GT82_9ROSI
MTSNLLKGADYCLRRVAVAHNYVRECSKSSVETIVDDHTLSCKTKGRRKRSINEEEGRQCWKNFAQNSLLRMKDAN